MGQTQVGPSGQKWNLTMIQDSFCWRQCNDLLFIKGECPLKSLFALALVVAFWIIDPIRLVQTWTWGALKETSLVSWTTLPETAAVWVTKGKVLRAWTSSYLQNARGSMVRSGWGRCIRNSLEPYYHRKVNIPLQGKYLPARLNGPEKFPSIYIASHLQPTSGCGVGSKARTVPKNVAALQSDSILKWQ